MRKLLLASGALAAAAAIGYLLGSGPPLPAPAGVAWAQRFLREPMVAGKVLIGREEVPGVLAVEGLEESCNPVEFRDGNTGEVRKLPGQPSVGNLSLTLAIQPAGSPSLLYDWFAKTAELNGVERKAGSIVLFNKKSGETVRQYNFYEGWPCKWYVPDMDSDQSGMAIEKIEIAIEKVERVK